MKFLSNFFVLFFFVLNAFAQKQTFDITTFTVPKGWKKESSESTMQFAKEDAAKGTYCMITLLKSMPGTGNAKENFDLSWISIVKEMVTVSTAPEMQPSAIEDGWEVLSGYATFEKDGITGVAVLVTSSGFEKMVNVIILTNTDVYQKDITAFLESVDLKKPAAEKQTGNTKPEPVLAVNQSSKAAAVSNGFAFTTTNFDDGWTSTVKEDWVEVLKNNIKVLIHYPNAKADAYNSVLKEEDYTAWNVLVAPRYSDMKNFEWRSIQSWESISFIEADAAENSSGKMVHIVLFKKHYSNGSGAYLEFVTSTKAGYENEFGAYHQTSYDWDKTANMQFRNKFAVSAADLKGTWTNNFTGMTQYVNAYTGASAGADTHASAQNFVFGSGDTYKWDIGVASGFVGNIKFQSAKSNGKFSVPNAWQVYFSSMEGKPKTYDAYFSCVKGSRLLWLSDVTYPGYTAFGKSH